MGKTDSHTQIASVISVFKVPFLRSIRVFKHSISPHHAFHFPPHSASSLVLFPLIRVSSPRA